MDETKPTPTIIELFLSQNHTNGNTWFLRGVPIGGTQKALEVYDLSLLEVLKEEHATLTNEPSFLSEIKGNAF